MELKEFVARFGRGSEIAVGANTIYIILSGDVEVYQNNEGVKQRISTLARGNFFGDAGSFKDFLTRTTYLARTDVIAVEISEKNCYSFFKICPEAALSIIKTILTNESGQKNVSARENYKISDTKVEFVRENVKPYSPKPPSPSPKITALTKAAAPPKPTQTAALKPATPAKSGQRTQKVSVPVPHAVVVDPDEEIQAILSGSLFPEGHGDYTLPLDQTDCNLLFEKEITCPVCRQKFKSQAVKSFKLISDGNDLDMRPRFRGIEPMYYDVIICPNCMFTAQNSFFLKGKKTTAFANKGLEWLKPTLKLRPHMEPDTYTVFAGYYLALICAPLCFSRHQLITANLWLKLCRMYSDCGDEKMIKMAAQKSLDAYMFSYENISVAPEQSPLLCTMIAELNCKLGEYKNARSFFFKVKTDRASSRTLKDHAEDRIEDLRVKVAD